MRNVLVCSLICFALSTVYVSADVGNYKVKTVDKAAPKELKADVQKLLDAKAIQFTDKKGDLIAELWFRKDIPVTIAPKDKKAVFSTVPMTSIIGAVKFAKDWREYRGRKLKAGVYSLRFAMQPQDGNHMGTALHSEFLILLAAKFEPSAKPLNPMELVDRSKASIKSGHPAILQLFPYTNDKAAPNLTESAKDHVVLNLRQPVVMNGSAVGPLGIGVTLVGEASE